MTDTLGGLQALADCAATGHDLAQALESFIAGALFRAGEWSSPRASDGVAAWRLIECSAARLRIVGSLWSFEQTEHVFWLDAVWSGPGIAWTLYFDIVAGSSSARAVRHAVDRLSEPTDAAWRVRLEGADSAQ